MIPDGELLRSRVVPELSSALRDVLDRRLDGYALVFSRSSLLGGDDETGVITFKAGVPVFAYHSRTDRGGPPAIEDVGSPPYRFELYEFEASEFELPHRTEALRVPPGALATRLADDPDLADRTRAVAADTETIGDASADTVEAFLDDEAAIEDIRRSAREEALDRANEWNLEDVLEE